MNLTVGAIRRHQQGLREPGAINLRARPGDSETHGLVLRGVT
jgi:hypothetical protein